MDKFKLKLVAIAFFVFICCFTLIISTADSRSDRISDERCKFINQTHLFHIVEHKNQLPKDHYIKMVYLRSLLTDSIILINPKNISTHRNLFDESELGDTIEKEKFSRVLIIRNKKKRVSILMNRCEMQN